ncbi:PadR family transcriptional regulator [Mixta theicola]|uniref:PadR family transcriptional regulator n=1 Tax=Mixta theicola TaxID=1458355 RepID=A0A2K1QEL5_9GAMM|nr:PadR family transcriptional regulator [Mixta theicola]PNS13472.1 PadR family transcriptional regulator [Mixta theicola]GLR09788.1 hypothetical protein GCM10007905_25080 [Mixta theicola]
MFRDMLNERRGGSGRSRPNRNEYADRAESGEEKLDMKVGQRHQAMRGERHHHRFAGPHGGRHEGQRGHRRGGGDSGQRDRPSFLRGRKFGADELQILLLTFLKQQASYGYELIKSLAEKSGGFYTPSPGVIYPALTYLEDVGHVSVQQEGNRKRYAINEQGESWLADNQAIADALLARLALFAQQSETVNQAIVEQRQPFEASLMQALHELRSQLHRYHGSDEETQRQVAVILQQTLAQLKSVGA